MFWFDTAVVLHVEHLNMTGAYLYHNKRVNFVQLPRNNLKEPLPVANSQIRILAFSWRTSGADLELEGPDEYKQQIIFT